MDFFYSRRMWAFIAAYLISAVTAENPLFHQDRIIFASDFNITSILVPADTGVGDQTETPNIFFTVADQRSEGGSCIYVLHSFAAYEILEGGRDTTSDYSFDDSIFFGARDGIYKYYPETLSAKKYGIFRDDIKQIQKANGSDQIYILTTENQLFRIRSNGTIKERVTAVPCAKEFVLDTSNNIYFISCRGNLPYIVEAGAKVSIAATLMDDFKDTKLIRPAFLMEKCVPFIGDGHWHIIYANGTSEKKNFFMDLRPSAYSMDAGVYLLIALDGKIYESNMDMFDESVFGGQESLFLGLPYGFRKHRSVLKRRN